MRLESARSLKAGLLHGGRSFRLHDRLLHSAGLTAGAYRRFRKEAPFALGIVGLQDKHGLAVRVHDPHPEVQKLIDRMRALARGEIHVQFIGRVHAQLARPSQRGGSSRLRIGDSIGLAAMTMGAGTLGCFVRPAGRDLGERFILSNNHVLANENRAKPGAAILHPGPADGGGHGGARVARFVRCAKLGRHRNRMDAALARVDEKVVVDPSSVRGFAHLLGVRSAPVHEKVPVLKLGRMSGLTRGRVSAFEVDGVQVSYPYPGVAVGKNPVLSITFDQQIEIAPVERSVPFSRGGDSGSLVVDGDHQALGLLFSGNDINITYVNPIDAVLHALRVELAL